MAKKKLAYINRFTGVVEIVSKQSAKKLSEDFSPVEFVTNEDGKPVMRFELENATVDVMENEEPSEVVIDGIGSSE